MSYSSLESMVGKQPKTVLLYCSTGVGKTTTLGIIAEKSKGKTLIIDIDRTITTTLGKKEVVKDLKRIDIKQVDIMPRQGGDEDKTTGTWNSWSNILTELLAQKKAGKLEYENICVDNISELERCILSDLGSQGKNKGVPAQGDYQYMQFKLVNSLRIMKQLGVNIYWTAWETVEEFVQPDGAKYNRLVPKINSKIVDNICGLCDIVGKILVKQDGTRGILLEATQNIYAKNQVDMRKGCLVEDFIEKEKGEK